MVYDCDVIYYSDQMLGRKHVKLFISYHVAPSWICNLPIISEGGVTSQIINYHANYVFIYIYEINKHFIAINLLR